jgi:hypothetical protein
MVQAAPNKTDLEGVVTSQSPHPQTPGFDQLTVLLERATPVDGFAELLSPRVGAAIEVLAAHDRVPVGVVGKHIRFRGTLAGPGVVRLDPTMPVLVTP